MRCRREIAAATGNDRECRALFAALIYRDGVMFAQSSGETWVRKCVCPGKLFAALLLFDAWKPAEAGGGG